MHDSYLKVSYYNHIFSYPDGLRLAYNALTGKLIELKANEGDRIYAILSGDQHSLQLNVSKRDMLKKLGFLVERDINEFNVVREIWRMRRRQGGDIALTILPTLACNFGCSYCYERHTSGLMSKEVQDRLVRFTRRHLLTNSNRLEIEWFGGEPLLGLSVIQSLSLRFNNLCAEEGISSPTAGITTNGYLLTPEMATRLKALGVKSAQVTLDGPPDVHNHRRPLAGGQGSFERILENLKTMPADFEVNIRINVDNGNKDSIFELLLLLFNEGIIPKATPYVAKVECFTENCRASTESLLTSEQFARFKRELHKRCSKAGIPWFSSGSPRPVAFGFCIVDQPKGFVVQPDGKLFKCWAEAGNKIGLPVADLLSGESRDNMGPSVLRNRDPFDDAECRECKILPICMGGCPRIRQNLRQQSAKQCPPIKYVLADEVHTLYLQSNPAKEND